MFSSNNKAKLGCFKDECAGKLLEEFILLKPKMYSMKYLKDDNSIKRAKGIQRSCVRALNHNSFKSVYNDEIDTFEDMTIINSENHVVYTKSFRKRGLSMWEDKRCWVGKNFSLPYGHYSLGLPPPSKRRKLLPSCGDIE